MVELASSVTSADACSSSSSSSSDNAINRCHQRPCVTRDSRRLAVRPHDVAAFRHRSACIEDWPSHPATSHSTALTVDIDLADRPCSSKAMRARRRRPVDQYLSGQSYLCNLGHATTTAATAAATSRPSRSNSDSNLSIWLSVRPLSIHPPVYIQTETTMARRPDRQAVIVGRSATTSAPSSARMTVFDRGPSGVTVAHLGRLQSEVRARPAGASLAYVVRFRPLAS